MYSMSEFVWQNRIIFEAHLEQAREAMLQQLNLQNLVEEIKICINTDPAFGLWTI